ncbi:hypothetical protein [Turicimonas sp. TL08]
MTWLRTFSKESLRKASISLVATAIGMFFSVLALVVLAAMMAVPVYAGIWLIHWTGLPLPF